MNHKSFSVGMYRYDASTFTQVRVLESVQIKWAMEGEKDIIACI